VTAGPVYPAPLVAWFTVVALFIAYIFSFIDRMIIGLLVEPMKADLNLTDTQISLLQGLAFAIFYTVLGLPLGRLIDRTARLKVAAAGVALWSLMTASCGLAGQYWQLFLARMGVGVGEATLSPAAYSIISDSFPARRMGLAMGVYGLGSAVGAGLAFFIGAAVVQFVAGAENLTLPIIGEVRAWQATFMIVGLPGLVIAAVFAVMPEPARLTAADPIKHVTVPLKVVGAFLRRRAGAVLGLCFAVGMVNFAVFAAVSWFPVFLMRVHGMGLVDAGRLAGGCLILGGLIGLVGGGWLTDKLGGTPGDRLRFCGLAAVVGTVCAVIFPLTDNLVIASGAFVIFFSTAAVPIGAAATALQQLTPNRMRATVSAVYLFIVNIIGLGAGPTATAMLGDMLFPFESGIRYAIAVASPVSFAIAAGLFLMAARYSRRDIPFLASE
tara:strand:- start:1093 stop:2409 length:1317 start_codon:yes stop_codon:yes gene_type:complete